MGKTLWERITEFCSWLFVKKESIPVETEYYNPLKAKLKNKSSLTIDTMDLRNYTFVVDKSIEFKLNYKDKSSTFTDYYCRSVLNEGDTINVKLRVYPHDTPGRELQVLVLKQWDELDYDEDFKSLLEDEQFNTIVDDEVEASFWRINNVKTPYKAMVKTIVDDSKTIEGEFWYWDYWRETVDEGQSKYKEFLFVEFDKGDTGRFTIWRGEEVPQSCVYS